MNVLICDDCGSKYSLREGGSMGGVCSCRGSLSVHADNGGHYQQPHPSYRTRSIPERDIQRLEDDIVATELVLPPSNKLDVGVSHQFTSSIPTPFALEFYGSTNGRKMMLRSTKQSMGFVRRSLDASWPRASLIDVSPDDDPAIDLCEGESKGFVASAIYTMTRPPFFPLKMSSTYEKGDPIFAILASLMGLNENEEMWIQMFMHRNDERVPSWLKTAQQKVRLDSGRGFRSEQSSVLYGDQAVVKAPVVEHILWGRGVSYVVAILFLLLAMVMFFLGHFFSGVLWGVIGFAVLFLSNLLLKRDEEWDSADLDLVRKKIYAQESFHFVTINCVVRANDSYGARKLMDRITAAFASYAVAGGNSLRMMPLERTIGVWPQALSFLPDDQREAVGVWLGNHELSDLWHIPYSTDNRQSLSHMQVARGNLRSPDIQDVQGPYKIGEAVGSGSKRIDVNVGENVLAKHTLCIGGTGTGKSTMMEHLILGNITDPNNDAAIVVIDPHGDMATHLLGAIPLDQADRVVYLDTGDTDYALSYNLLDGQTYGRDAKQAAYLIVDSGKALWPDYWGPRMQVPLMQACTLIASANENRPVGEKLGLSLLNSVLLASPEARAGLIEAELAGHPEQRAMRRYFNDYAQMTPSFKEQVISPVISKGIRFMETPMKHLFSSPTSNLDIQDILVNRKILIVNTRQSLWGDELSSFIGSQYLNIIKSELVRQGEIGTRKRVPVNVVVDEFQTVRGVDWEAFIGQIRKFGGRVTLGCQSFAALRREDGSKELPEIILSGTGALFCFQVNGQDAQYLSEKEFSFADGGPSPEDLINLGEYWAYARIKRAGLSGDDVAQLRPVRPFAFQTRPPASYIPSVAQHILDNRASYCAPFDEVNENSERMIDHLDNYGSQLFNSNAGAPKFDTTGGHEALRAMNSNKKVTSPESADTVTIIDANDTPEPDLLESDGLTPESAEDANLEDDILDVLSIIEDEERKEMAFDGASDDDECDVEEEDIEEDD